MPDAARRRVVVDGSNLATEGRTTPSLRQLDEAVKAYALEDADAEIVVVVDASFEHRIDPAERQELIDAELHGEVVSPPAGAIGRGDAFVLRIAERTGARVLSNDSFQEFHAEHPWLFDEGRLVGGKPVPGVGWIFTPRIPVRGPKSRQVTKKKRGGAETLSPPVKAAELARAAKKVAARKPPAALPDGSPPKVGDVWPAIASTRAARASSSTPESAGGPVPDGVDLVPTKLTAKKAGAKKTAAKKTAAKKTAAEKSAAEKSAAEKSGAEKSAGKKTAAKKTAAKKTATKGGGAENGAVTESAASTRRAASRAGAVRDVVAAPVTVGERGAEEVTPTAVAARGAKKEPARKVGTKRSSAKTSVPTRNAAAKAAPTKAATTKAATTKAGVKKAATTKAGGKKAGAKMAAAGALAADEQAREGATPATSLQQTARTAAREDPVVKDAIDRATAEALSPVASDELAASRSAGAKADGAARTKKKGKGAARAREEKKDEKRSRRRPPTALPAVNEPLAFINFVATYPLLTTIDGEVVSFTSHGAMVDVDLPDGGALHCYIPLTAMGDPPPTKAREVLRKGEHRQFVLVGLDPPRRVAELALPGAGIDPAKGAR
ncbi:MAG: NYN domain-containing protein [Acidimicrobiales bacterium]